jgi:hypothetical protein
MKYLICLVLLTGCSSSRYHLVSEHTEYKDDENGAVMIKTWRYERE